MKYFLCKQGSCYSEIVDYHLNILKRVVGLQASAGIVIFPQFDSAKGAVFVDGRYSLAANISVDKTKFDIEDLQLARVVRWIKSNLQFNDVLSIDKRCFSYSELKFLRDNLCGYYIELFDSYDYFNLQFPVKTLNQYNLGDSKITQCIEWLQSTDLDAYLFGDPCFVSWMFGIRDLNNVHTCAVLCYLLITRAGEVSLYTSENYVHQSDLKMKSLADINADISALSKVGCNFDEISAGIFAPNLINVTCPLDQAIKTQKEIDDIKTATEYDSIAIIKFLNWFYSYCDKITEIDVVSKLDLFRRECPNYIGNSFETIAAADEHGAIIHYEPTVQSNIEIKNILLLDSGGQYKNGTTDITRTISRTSPTEYEKRIYTLVLKGHIALANAKFSVGTTGAQLDVLARQFLWQNHLDYRHGTGHGIGYLLNVHEGNYSFSKGCHLALKPNILLSNEPGYYEANHFGVRLENMMLSKNIYDDFLCFETISLVPFDFKFIENQLLTAEEKIWLDEYNDKIEKLCNKFNIKMELK